MKISENWLRTWVNPPVSRTVLIDQLTNAGLEVADCFPASADLEGVVVAKVGDVINHPEDAHLQICIVDDGKTKNRVVCGAPNLRRGMTSAFARIGATLPDGTVIRKQEFRGHASEGMLCSEAELDLSSNGGGVLDLDAGLQTGEPLYDALGLDDWTIDIDLTPNRGDCFSICGVAREVGVYNKLQVSCPDIIEPPTTDSDEIPIQIEDGQGCPRYLGKVIKGIDINAPTPLWMLNRLRGCGLRSINPVVDAANYVMLELGQPVHAFDLNRVAKGIGVRKARIGETLELLDGAAVDLQDDVLLITSDDQPVAMAGVIGGMDSGIQDTTTHIFLECAYFAPEAIMGTARRYGLHTDASTRYERGVDPSIQGIALARLTDLLVSIVGGTVCPTTVAESEFLPQSTALELREARLNSLVGEVLPKEEVAEIITRLGFDPRLTKTGWRVTVPSHRFDISIEEDLIEEVCRIHDYNSIESRLPETQALLTKDDSLLHEARSIKHKLKERGYIEVFTYSFVDPEKQQLVHPDVSAILMRNPMSSDRSAMRCSLLTGLLEAMQHNLNRQQETVRLFETGLCFNLLDSGEISQQNRTAGILAGSRWPHSWAHSDHEIDFFDVKGDIESLFGTRKTGIRFVPGGYDFFHPGRSAVLEFDKSVVGFLGQLSPRLIMELEIPSRVYFFELDSSKLLEIDDVRVQPVSPYPAIRRDLALIVHKASPVAEIENVVRKYWGEKLTEYHVFDIYTGPGIGNHEKSVGVSMTLQDVYATLTDEFVQHTIDKILDDLANSMGARLRR